MENKRRIIDEEAVFLKIMRQLLLPGCPAVDGFQIMLQPLETGQNALVIAGKPGIYMD